MGWKDVQVLLLLLMWLYCGDAFGELDPGNGIASSPQSSLLGASNSSWKGNVSNVSNRSPEHSWQVTESLSTRTILTAPNKEFTFSLMFIDQSKAHCAATVLHINPNVTVWVANFDVSSAPNQNSPPTKCVLHFTQDGLVLTNDAGEIWSARNTTQGNQTSTLKLEDNGCLTLSSDSNPQSPWWQSFDYPTDTLILEQKLKLNMSLSAAQWDSSFSKGGLFYMRVDRDLVFTLLQTFEYNGTLRNVSYSNFSALASSPLSELNPVTNVISYVEITKSGLHGCDSSGQPVSSIPSNGNSSWRYARLEPDGGLRITSYFNGRLPEVQNLIGDGGCLIPSKCGSYGVCSGQGNCSCPERFEQKAPPGYRAGCKRILPLPSSTTTECRGDTFVTVSGKTYLDIANNTGQNVDKEGCLRECNTTCTCTMALHVRQGGESRCYLDLEDSMQTIRQTMGDDTQTLFLRVRNLPPGTSSVGGSNSNSPRKTIALAFAGVAGALVFVLCAVSVWFLHDLRQKLFAKAENGMFESPNLPPRFTYKELVESTSNFAQQLGYGGFSSVYAGLLPDITKIAVKKLDHNDRSKEEDFVAAVATVASINPHPNLVPLRGFCAESQHRLLVSELVNEGRSLNRFLFHMHNSSLLINTQTRRGIALGAARGLAHLHESYDDVIHGSVKPENIMVDRKMVPRLVDFGLVDLMTRDQRLHAAAMRGSCGYMAPEWFKKTASITEKVDVYSLGVVMLELVSGRQCLKQGASEEKCFLPTWGFSLLHRDGDLDSVLELVDPLLDVRALPETDQQMLKGMICVALWCVQEEASLRLSMKDVVRKLEGGTAVDTPPVSTALFAFARDLCAGSLGERAPESSTNTTFMHSTSLSKNAEMRPR